MRDQTVIIGAGHAGTTLAASLRENGYEGGIVLVGAETHAPYHRPPLSKDFLTSATDDIQLLRPECFYADHRIDLRLGQEAREIDPAGRRVALGAGPATPFTRLAIATGGRPRQCRAEHADADGIEYLRSIADARRIKSRLPGLQQLVIAGGGFIGLELAAHLSEMGVAVTVLEASDRLMGRAVAEETSRHFLDQHRAWGVEGLLGEGLGRFVADSGRLIAVETTCGRRIDTTMVVVGIGIEPNVEICRAAGFECDNGVVVDDRMLAGPDGVVAVGDCANFRYWRSGSRVRVESVQNATDQARVAARSLLGHSEPYRAVPWFWSDQRQTKLQIAGLPEGADEGIVRGNPADGRFSVFRYRGNRLVAVDSINRPGEHLVARRLIAAALSPSRVQAADPDFDLKTLTASQSSSGSACDGAEGASRSLREGRSGQDHGNGELRVR
jgi:3-phenylpropionate/trans-cinnamate dioxygenase ferredoxin reductase subunit